MEEWEGILLGACGVVLTLSLTYSFIHSFIHSFTSYSDHVGRDCTKKFQVAR